MKAEKIIDKGNWEISIKKMNVLNDGVRVLKFIGREDKVPAYNAIMGRIVKKEYSYTKNTLAATRHNGPCVVEMYCSHSYYQAPIETVKHINVIYQMCRKAPAFRHGEYVKIGC